MPSSYVALGKLLGLIILIVIGYFRGRRNRVLHLTTLKQEEADVKDILIFATRQPDTSGHDKLNPILVSGNAVIGTDHFRIFLSSLRKFIGGNQPVYEDLTQRARRQAVIRMKQMAKRCNATMIFNVKYETTQIANNRQNEPSQVEVLAYGTAFVVAQGSVADSVVHYHYADEKSFEEHYILFSLQKKEDQIILAVIFGLGFYLVFEAFNGEYSARFIRYMNGAPWLAFTTIAIAITAWCLWYFRRTKILWTDIFISMIFIPILTASLYFMTLRINGLTAEPWHDERYILQANLDLKPVKAGLPIMHFDKTNDDYWREQPLHTETIIRLQRGWFCYQYDAAPWLDRFYEFHRRR